MDRLRLPYVLNILILLPIAPLTLLGGSRGCQRVFEGKFSDSPGIRTIVGSQWTAILLGSVLGLFYPAAMSPLLIVQVIYKSLWLLCFALPCALHGRIREVPLGVALSFLFIVLTYPSVIPWNPLFAH